ncbi:hypothetical protein ASPBRDRAFT_60243 [Aspergillus brasiliensis CBS 101740]|uniref:Protein kinase domain-containing protein n=1 Tax=Aspergillus brasiliensis (strain CBS 101740 / IMI 381727 / IBT 21946) TaxID=767769 RepID=A0A1L9U2H6_ASPBC|nr:hypothetical protein ASPBRDRAFT_60243 [Aspergillus brasiliensis CBS 101740]
MSEIVPSQFVAVGSVSSIHIFDSNHVIKRSPPSSDKFARRAFDIEVRAYERLGNHRRIAVLSDVTSEGIIIQSPESGKITMCTRLRWAQEASEGLCRIHSKGIIHADVGCHNLLLDQSGHIRFIDFAGSGIDDEPPMVTNSKTDIFAFGSTLFEIESGHVLYHELCETMEIFHALREAEQRFVAGEYPNMENLLFRHWYDGEDGQNGSRFRPFWLILGYLRAAR